MAETVSPDDINAFLDNAAWNIHSTHHTVLNASSDAAISGRNMLFDIPLIAKLILTWHAKTVSKATMITKLENKLLLTEEGILRKAHIARSHGLSQQSIQMELSGFNAEQNWKDLISGE